MDFDKVLADLNEQLRNLDLAIESLERLQNGEGNRRRGRPPQRVSRAEGDPKDGGRGRR
jgi:hypothetical protein